jgi:tRNA(Leu) C34 or U34 (ribose-2'-O)-methylase TrmL
MRSLNVAMAAALAVGEASRQTAGTGRQNERDESRG